MEQFLRMGGYAEFVWPCYALTLAVLGWNVWSARRQHSEALARALRRAAAPGSQP